MDKKFLLVLFVALLVSCLGAGLMFGREFISDEGIHFDQISMFLSGDYSIHRLLTVIPGYHAIIASLMSFFGATSFSAARIITTLFLTLALIPIFWMLTGSIRRVCQLYLFPLMFVFYFLIYTDLTSLVFVLLAVWFLTRKLYCWSGVFFILSMVIRQNNFVWLLFGLVYILFEDWGEYHVLPIDWGYVFNKARLKAYFTTQWFKRVFVKCWTYFTGIILFGLFVIINHGLVIGDRGSHPPGFYWGNVLYLLFMMCIIFWPLILFKCKDIWSWITTHKVWSVIIVLFVFFACVFLFHNTHWYNNLEAQAGITGTGMLRNTILHSIDISLTNRLLFAIPIILSIFVIIITPLSNKLWYLIYPFTILIVGASELVDPRYYFVPFSLFIIFRQSESEKIEWYLTTYWIILSILMFLGIYRHSMMW